MSELLASKDLKELSLLWQDKEYAKGLIYLEKNKSLLSPSVYFYNKALLRWKLGQSLQAKDDILLADQYVLYAPEIFELRERIDKDLGIAYIDQAYKSDQALYQLDKVSYITLSSIFIGLVIITFVLFKNVKKLLLFNYLGLSLLLLGGIYLKESYDVVSLNSQAKVYEGPSIIMPVKEELEKGVTVIIKVSDVQSNWVKIIRPKRLSGWIKSEQISFVSKK